MDTESQPESGEDLHTEAGAFRILVVDDEESMRHFLVRGLKRRGHAVRAAASADEGIAALAEERADLVLLDIMMPQRTGLEALPEILGLPEAPRVVMMTAFATVETAVEALKKGARDYVTKPLSLPEIARVVAREQETAHLERENRALREALGKRATTAFRGMSAPVVALRKELQRVARSPSTVLLLGESGTGKEVAARAIHEGSPRAGGPFVAVNCGALPEGILESELFGYFPGAFTGASRRKIGIFERADGGTLFLDEIGELPLSFQVHLLRVLQEKEVLPLGGTGPVKVDFRLVAASNRDLEKDMIDGRFREDLYYRINVISLRMPPLRERPGDATLLARHFLQEFAGGDRVFAEEVFPLLEAWSWPGNVRELMNLVERCTALAGGRVIGPDAMPEDLRACVRPAVPPPPLKEARSAFERDYMEALLRAADGNVSKAARLSGMSRPNLHGKIRELGLDPSRFKRNRKA